MKKINILLSKNKDKLQGDLITDEEAKFLKEKLSKLDIIEDWIKIIVNYKFIGVNISFAKANDMSRMGGELQIMTPLETLEESFDYYPGIVAVKKGFLPIGKCMEGSGDPYFLRKEVNNINLYRIPHESLDENDEINLSDIELINDFSIILEHGIQ